MPSPFAGQVAVITGAASGIGKALAEELAARGSRVILVDVDRNRVQTVASALAASGASAEAVALDVRDAAAVQEAVDETVRRHGRLDLMVNNAGIGVGGAVRDLTLEHWNRIVDVNLKGVIHGVAAAFPVMIRQGSGHIVNTASLAGLVPAPHLVPYSATKHAVVGLSTSLRTEAATYGIKVSVVCPGYIDTPIYEASEMVNTTLDGKTLRDLLPFKLYPPDRCARDILRGVERDDPVIVVTAHAKWIWWIHRLCPRLLDPIARRQFQVMRDHRR